MASERRRIFLSEEDDPEAVRWASPTTFGEKLRTFYLYFAAAYGTLFLVVLVVATVTSSHLETGLVGFVGFPVIAAIYAGLKLKRLS